MVENKTPKFLFDGATKIIKGFVPKDQKGKTLRTFPRKPEDSRLKFNTDLDWNYRMIRASSKPFSGAFCFLNNTDCKVSIFRGQPVRVNYDFCAVNGQIIEI